MVNKSYIKKIKHGGFRSLIKRAIELGVNVKTFSEEPLLLKLEYKGEVIFASKGNLPFRKMLGELPVNKQMTKTLLENIGVRTPKGVLTKSYEEALVLIKKNRLTYPLIVKPVDGSLAIGVSWDIQTPDQLKKAVSLLMKSSTSKKSKFLVEEMFMGDEFRILVFNGKVLSCVKKIPATIIGDGHSTIKDLVKSFNKSRIKGFEMKLDKIAKRTLLESKLKLTSILPANHALKLRNNLNMSDGGRSVECTSEISKHLKDVCVRAIEAAGLNFGGVDLITKNITTKKNDYVILEINHNPYYNMHEKPLVEGKSVDVSGKILEYFFQHKNK